MSGLPARQFQLIITVVLLLISSAAHAQQLHIVTVGDSFFSPSNLTIQAGDTVRWTNGAGGMLHDVTADDGSFASQTASSFTFEVTFDTPGEFRYYCSVHGAPGGAGMSGTITVEGAGGGGTTADLVLEEIGVNNNINYQPGGSLTIETETTNSGSETSPAYTVNYYASTDTTITSGDVLLGSTNRNALGVGNSDNFNVNVTLPQSLAPGNYFIGGIIDIDDANNGNNSNFDDETINVQSAPPPAELALQSVNAPAGPFAQGDPITIQSVVQNTGGQSSGPYSLTFYASADNSISSTDAPLGTANRSSLAAGASNNNPFNGMIPVDLPPGSYFIGAIVDFSDGNANNNVNLDNATVQVVDGSGTAFVINSGLNDAWYNELTDGQGFFITVFPDMGAIFLAWFTYDTELPPPSVTANLGEPGHRWLTAFGNYAGNLAVLGVELTEGGVFDSATPPVVQTQGYGTIEIEFIDCNNAIIRYDIPSAGVMGEIPITRISTDNVPECLAAQPQ